MRLPFVSFKLGFAIGWYPWPNFGFSYLWNRPTGCRAAMIGSTYHYFATPGRPMRRLERPPK
jgi:hypothetical protein